MSIVRFFMGCSFVLALVTNSYAQLPQPTEHHKVLEKEKGSWKATTRLFMGPAGPVDEPMESTAKEVNEMMGGFWVVSTFEGNFGGMPFKGSGTFGYDEKIEKYVGTWVDSFGPHTTKMIGTYDKAKNTMVYMTTGVGPDGKPAKGKNVVVYDGDDRRKMTMYMKFPGADEMVRVMEIDYVREKK